MAFSTFLNTPLNEGAAFVLTSPGVDLGTGFRVELGAGTDTHLWLDSGAVGVMSSGGFRHRLVSEATDDRNVYLADTGGILTPEQIGALAGGSSISNSTTTAADITGLTATLEAGGLYEFETQVWCHTGAVTHGAQIGLTGTANVFSLRAIASHLTDTSMATGALRTREITGLDQFLESADAPSTGRFLVTIRGLIHVQSTGGSGGTLKVQYKSSAGGSNVNIYPGSYLRVRKLPA